MEEENLTNCLERAIILSICVPCSYLITLSYSGMITKRTALQKMPSHCTLIYVVFMHGIMVSQLLTAYGPHC